MPSVCVLSVKLLRRQRRWDSVWRDRLCRVIETDQAFLIYNIIRSLRRQEILMQGNF